MRLIRRPGQGSSLPRHRSGQHDGGAVTILLALLLGGGVLLGMAALTIDVGTLFSERRELQNGADASALAVAQGCARASACDTSSGGVAAQYANSNAKDAAANVTTVCGSGVVGLSGCSANTGPQLTRCLGTVPSAASGWVEVRTATRTAAGSTLLPPVFARTLTGNAAYAGTTVSACARAAWGPVGSLSVAFPVTFSRCEYNYFTSTSGLSAPPTYSSTNPRPSGREVAILLKDPQITNAPGTCPSSPPGGDRPGGFGWIDLDSGAGCAAAIDVNGVIGANPGSTPAICDAAIAGALESVIYIPVYDSVSGTGNTAEYHVNGFAAFYLSGYRLAGGLNDPGDNYPGNCTTGPAAGGTRCLYGWFVSGLAPTGGTIGSGIDYGVRVVQLAG